MPCRAEGVPQTTPRFEGTSAEKSQSWVNPTAEELAARSARPALPPHQRLHSRTRVCMLQSFEAAIIHTLLFSKTIVHHACAFIVLHSLRHLFTALPLRPILAHGSHLLQQPFALLITLSTISLLIICRPLVRGACLLLCLCLLLLEHRPLPDHKRRFLLHHDGSPFIQHLSRALPLAGRTHRPPRHTQAHHSRREHATCLSRLLSKRRCSALCAVLWRVLCAPVPPR